MPKIHLPIPDVEQMVIRPIVTKVIQDLLVWTGQDTRTVEIIYPGESIQTFQPGSTMSSQLADDDQNRFRGDEQIEVEVNEQYDPNRLKSTPILYPNQKVFFLNEALEACMFPIKSHTELTLTLRLRFRDANKARRWRDDIRNRISQDRGERVHELHFSYGIPEHFMEILKSVHGLSEKQGGYGLSWEQWWLKHSSQKLQMVTDRAGENEAWVMTEKQIRALGWFEWEVPEPNTREDEPVGWTASFSYKLMFDKPLAVALFYPNVVHNSVIPRQYRNVEQIYDLDDRQINGDAMTMNLYQFESRYIRNIRPPYAQDRIPYWDEFRGGFNTPTTIPVLDTLCLISEADKQSLMDYSDLGDRRLSQLILDYIQSEGDYIRKPLQSVFLLSLYENEELMHASSFILDGTAVKAANDLDVRKTYHLRLSLVSDWTILTQDALNRLRHHGELVMMLLCYLGYTQCQANPGVFSNIPQQIDSDWIWKYFDDYCTKIIPRGLMWEISLKTALKPSVGPMPANIRATVGSFYIATERATQGEREDAAKAFPDEDWWHAIHWPENPPDKKDCSNKP